MSGASRPNHEFLIPGEGEMDYVRYLRAMDQAGYDGHIVVEISLDGPAPTRLRRPRRRHEVLAGRVGSLRRGWSQGLVNGGWWIVQ